ncbi:tRNA (guanosine(37)-N1)-methyltransferase TrmD [Gammaproteobacteria bacterium]|jgi:tRNA (guanine37-N1)-methyltransferase|nr:tRNA (guanosine(37)-N1)-methyltransferase TrmD [Gammaproteobacteria bacterium]
MSQKPLQIDVISLFPEFTASIAEQGVVGRAIQQGKAKLNVINPRQFSTLSHERVDDRPYGGGPGMVMQFEPLQAAIMQARGQSNDAKVIYLSPQGQSLRQESVRRLAKESHLILLCGRYEGIDERLIEAEVDEEWSIGDYVISGGELAAMVMIDAMVRTLPGALGGEQSAEQDSFENGLLDCPHYTRPESVAGREVPSELLSGDHKKIARWRLQQALVRTYLRRPDLLDGRELTDEERQLLEEFLAASE